MSTIDHDYGDDSRCRVCNAYGPNEDHIPCTANTTAPTTDRAAIEALARELTDDVWSFVLSEPGSGIHAMAFCQACIAAGFVDAPPPREIITALLAYLDEVWAGLTTLARKVIDHAADHHAGRLPTAHGATLALLRDRQLVGWNEADESDLGSYLTPLGRAVLKRAKEQGR